MKKILKNIYFYLFLVITIFTIIALKIYNTETRSIDEVLVSKINAKTVSELSENYDLPSIGWGRKMNLKYYELSLPFRYEKTLKLESARGLILIAIHTYLKNINDCQEFQIYLKNSPFKLENIDITIYIDNDETPFTIVYCRNGIITYKKFQDYPLKNLLIHEETYKEALKASKKQSDIILTTKTSNYKVPKKDYIRDKIVIQITDEISKLYALRPISFENNPLLNGPIKIHSIGFAFDNPASIEKARELIIKCIDKYIHDMNLNPELKPYLKEKPFTLEDLSIEIDFRKTSTLPLNFVETEKGKILYQCSNTYVPRTPCLEETYEESLEKLAGKKNANLD